MIPEIRRQSGGKSGVGRDAPGFFHGLNILVKPWLALQNAMDHPVFFIHFFFSI